MYECGPNSIPLTCPDCGSNLDAIYDYKALTKSVDREKLTSNPDLSLWRYLPFLPVKEAPLERSIRPGGTPLVNAFRLADLFGVDHLWIKDESRNPSLSLKDRASAVGIRHAIENDNSTIVAASTGNAAASLSVLGASAGVNVIILAPASAPKAKLVQILQAGAALIPVDGSYDDAFDLSLELTRRFGFYSRNTGVNPVLSEGKKTVAFEIAEQLEWNAPDVVFVPVGDGCILGGVYKGFYDLHKVGWIDQMPKLVAVQASGSDAILESLEAGERRTVRADTLADSISVDQPRDWQKAVRAVKESDGFGIRVSDREILEAQKLCSEQTGIFGEPAAAASLAGYQKALDQGKIQTDERAVLLMTGSGLKDLPSALKNIEIPEAVEPSIAALEKRLKDLQ